MERFYNLIEELGGLLNQKLFLDQNRACQLIFDEQQAVQIEIDMSGEKLLLGSFLCDVPPGRFREEVLKAALKANFSNPLELGTLSYVERNNKLSLFTYIQIRELTAEKLLDAIALFVEKALRWKDAVEGGRAGPQEQIATREEKGPFGLKP